MKITIIYILTNCHNVAKQIKQTNRHINKQTGVLENAFKLITVNLIVNIVIFKYYEI